MATYILVPGAVTLESWTDQITALAQSVPEPIVLVGHSRGGMPPPRIPSPSSSLPQ